MLCIEFILKCFQRKKTNNTNNINSFDKYKFYKKKYYKVQKFNPKLNVIYEENIKYNI